MPFNFKDADAQKNNKPAQPNPVNHPPADDIENQEDIASKKDPSLEEILTSGMSQDDKAKLSALRANLVEQNAIIKFMFEPNPSFTFKLNKLLELTITIMPSDVVEDVQAYLWGKDPFDLFTEKDSRQIKQIMDENPDLSSGSARELFLRLFPKDIAELRHLRVTLAATILAINGKSTGNDLKSRFNSMAKLPMMTLTQMHRGVDLLDRAVKLELSSEESLKN